MKSPTSRARFCSNRAPRRKPLAAGAGVDGFARRGYGRIGNFPPRASTGKHRTLMRETFQRGSVGCIATALEHDFPVPFEPIRLEHLENRLGSPPSLTRPIEILHAHQPSSPVPARLEVAADRGDERAEMQQTGRGGCKAPTIGSRRVMHNLNENHISVSGPAEKSMTDRHRIVIVGGGAGGIELATRAGDHFGRRGRATVTLVDKNETHLWKPLLHEVAAGSMDIHAHQLDYPAQARWHHFSFCYGALEALDRGRREISVAPVLDERGAEVIPRRALRYDTLVLAVGSVANSFGMPGVAEHAFALDSADEADRFHRRLVNACLRANYRASPERPAHLRVVIVGGGATGVELAAELHSTTRVLAAYGLENIDPERYLRVTLVNADSRLLAQLPERISLAVTETLEGLGVRVVGSELAVEVAASEVKTKSGKSFPADIAVWAAGIKGADILNDIDGLETNRLNQLVILPTLQTTRDPDIFALGDCSVLPREGRMP